MSNYPDNNTDNTEYLTPPDTDYPEPIPDSDSFPQFAAAIRTRGMEHFEDTGMLMEDAESFLRHFAILLDTALIKFAAGQREHGGRLGNRPIPFDMKQEIMDLFCYQAEKDSHDATLTVSVS